MRWAAALLALAAAPACAQTLLIAEVASEPLAEPDLRLLFAREDGRWLEVGAAVSAAVNAGRLREPGQGPLPNAAAARLPQAEFAEAVFGRPVDLQRWYGLNSARVPVDAQAGDAGLFRRPCARRWGRDEWGIALGRQLPKDRVLTSRPAEVFDFVPESGDDWKLRDPGRGDWRLASEDEEAAVVADYRRAAASRDRRPVLPDAAARAELPLVWTSLRADLGVHGALVWIDAYRELNPQEEFVPSRCTGPALVYEALFHVAPDDSVRRVDAAVYLQDCEQEPWLSTRREPRTLLRIDGEFLLLQSDFAPAAHGMSAGQGLYAVDASSWKPATTPFVRRVSDLCSNLPNPLPEQ